ncbi:hypothetical protein HK104_003994 [Borealophlyctis nickersoniae]|nr:hypothetical protein HK104_003994 [Borealophlyctis nickersoniae]
MKNAHAPLSQSTCLIPTTTSPAAGDLELGGQDADDDSDADSKPPDPPCCPLHKPTGTGAQDHFERVGFFIKKKSYATFGRSTIQKRDEGEGKKGWVDVEGAAQEEGDNDGGEKGAAADTADTDALVVKTAPYGVVVADDGRGVMMMGAAQNAPTVFSSTVNMINTILGTGMLR